MAKSNVCLVQTVTFWTPTGNNGTGGKTWTVGATTLSKIADTDDIVNQSEGKVITASKSALLKIDVPVGSYIVEGDQTGEIAPTAGAQQVIQFMANPLTDLRRVLLL